MTRQPAQHTSGRVLRLNARPEPVEIDLARSAVIVVDMQNDFCSPGGMFDRAGIDISVNQVTVGPTARVLAAAREMGTRIVYLKMGFLPDLSDAGPADAPNLIVHRRLSVGETVQAPDGRESRILIRDTWNTDIIPELEPQPDDIVIYKTRYSGFYKTELDTILKEHGIKYLIVTGCTTSICVESTIRDAMFRDYSCVLLADCAAEPLGYATPRSNHEASLLNIQALFGWVSESNALLDALGAGVPTAAQTATVD
jgi:ureidoacrylate peracid hydrolase